MSLHRSAFDARDLVLVAQPCNYRDPRERPLGQGDIVVLNSGGPRMMIVDISPDRKCVAAWRDMAGVVQEHLFGIAAVHRVSPI